MRALIDDIVKALEAECWVLALNGALTIPDVCAALQSQNGQSNGAKYRKWCEDYFFPLGRNNQLDADELWKLRCSMLHQSRPVGSRWARMIFSVPTSGITFHMTELSVDWSRGKVVYLNVEIDRFCNDMIEAQKIWSAAKLDDPVTVANLSQVMQWGALHAAGYEIRALL